MFHLGAQAGGGSGYLGQVLLMAKKKNKLKFKS